MKLTKNNKNDQLYKKFRKNQRQSEVAGQFNAMLCCGSRLFFCVVLMIFVFSEEAECCNTASSFYSS